jgi:hypothetical protein
MLEHGETSIANDGEKPSAGIAPGIALEGPEGLEHAFLHSVLGILRMAQEPARKAVGGADVGQDADLKFTALP